MMRRIAVILFCVLICQAMSAQELGRKSKYGYPIPCNIPPIALDIKGDISEVFYINNFIRNEFGDLIVETNENIDETYRYNSNGQLEEYSTSEDGVIWGLRYDHNGNLSAYRGKYPDWTEPVYENGKLSKLMWRGRHYRFFYTNGTINKAVLYTDYGSEFSAWYFQNEDPVKLVFQGNTTTFSYKNHKITNIISNDKNETWSYNDKGLVSRITNNRNGTYRVYTYEYDTRGNWIKRVEIDRDKNGNIYGSGLIPVGKETVRKITYKDWGSTSQNTGSKTTSSATEQNTGSSNTRCDALLTSFMEYCNHKDWDEAYNPWTVLFKECPECSEYMYIYGEAFVKQQIDLVDISERGPWVDTLMMIYDQRIKYFAAKSKIYDEGYLLGRKGFDLFRYRGILRRKEAYDILRKSIDLKGEKSEADVIWAAARASLILYRDNQINLSEFTNNYEQYKKLLPLIDCKESEREKVSNELSCMASDINR